MPEYRAAVIGLGRMGSTFDDEMREGGVVFRPYCHGPAYFYSPLVELVAGADIHDEQRAIFGERWGLSSDHVYSDYKEMLERERLDIVSVSTTARHRAAIVQDVARAGVKAIWAEKPICMSLEEADNMVRVCREEGAVLAVNCARRWSPQYIEARNIIDSGELGDVLQVTTNFRSDLSSFGSHLLDTVRFLAGGDVQWVFGEMESDEAAATDDDIMGNAYLSFDNGARAFVRAMPCGEVGPVEFDVIAERGRISISEGPVRFELIRLGTTDPFGVDFHGPSSKIGAPLPVSYPIPLPPQVQGTGLTIVEDLINAIETGQPPRCSGEDGRAALEIGVAMRESHRRGGVKVTLPLEDRSLKIIANETTGDEVPRRIRRQREAAAR